MINITEHLQVHQDLLWPSHSIVSKPRQIITAALAVYAASLLPGDLVETGVYTGGTSVIMARVIRHLSPRKQLFACDSFKGLPPVQAEDRLYRQCKKCAVGFRGQFRSSREHFERYLRNEKLETVVQIVEGFYHNTLPPRQLRQIAFLRLDGDIYNSTMTALRRLYPLVVSDGLVYIDDYGSFNGCKRAVDDFLSTNRINVTLESVFEDNGKVEAVWFQKVGM